jgi:hypothetical protein
MFYRGAVLEASPGKGRWIAVGKTERFSIAALLRVPLKPPPERRSQPRAGSGA